jgi:hypothetical protein
MPDQRQPLKGVLLMLRDIRKRQNEEEKTCKTRKKRLLN